MYSLSPFGTGDLRTGTPTISISNGIATLSVAQTGNIGCGCCIEYNSLKVYVVPNRIGFTSGGTTELLPDTKIAGVTSNATGIVRFVEVTGGTWAGGDAAGWIYFESTTGTWNSSEQINRTKPTASTNIANTNSSLQGNIGNGATEWVIKTPIGGTPANQSATAVTSIHHEYASLFDFEAGFTDSSHVNNTDLTAADVVAHACCYYDHDDYTADTAQVTIDFGITDATRYLQIYTPYGGAESVNKQRHSAVWDDNKYKLAVLHYNNISISTDHVRVKGLQISLNNDWSGTDTAISISTVLDVRVSCCIINLNSSNGTANGITSSSGSGTIRIWNNIIYTQTVAGTGVTSSGWNPSLHVYNNTLVELATGFQNSNGSSSAYTSINNIAQDCVDGFSGGSNGFNSDSDYNASTISGDAPNTGGSGNDNTLSPWYSGATPATDIYDDPNNDNYELKLNSIFDGIGKDIISNPNIQIWRDIDGNERSSTPDIGAFEYVAAAGVSIPVIISHLRQQGIL